MSTSTAATPEIKTIRLNGDPQRLPAQTGVRYRVLLREGSPKAAATEAIATQRGQDLHVLLADGSVLIVEGFFAPHMQAELSLVAQADGSEHLLRSGEHTAATVPGAPDMAVVYFQGHADALLQLSATQPALHGFIQNHLGAAHTPGAWLAWQPSLLDGLGIGSLSTPMLGGLALGGLALAGGGGGGGGIVAPAIPLVSTVVASIIAGPVVAGNDLIATVYAADGSTVLLSNQRVQSDGTVSLAITGYTGVVIIKVQNDGGIGDTDLTPDYLDEATGVAKDLGSATLYSTSTITQAGSSVTQNVNVLTSLAYYKAVAVAGVSNALSATLVSNTNTAIAQAFGLSDLTGTTIQTVVDVGGSSQSSNLYGQILAALSGADHNNGGSMQATIDSLLANITLSGSTATLSDAALTILIQGASSVPGSAGLNLVSSVLSATSQTSSAVSINAVTSDNTLNASERGTTITGTNADGASVALTIGSTTRTATVTGTNWTYTLVAEDITAMGEGAQRLVVTSILGGTTAQATRTLIVDTTAPTANFGAATDDVGTVTGALTSGSSTDDTALLLSGSCTAGNIVNVYNGSTLLGAATVSGSGWRYTATVADATTYQFNVKETDTAGNTSAATSNFTVIGSSGGASTPTTGVVSIDTIASDNTLNASERGTTLTGSNTEGASVALTIGSTTRTATVTGTTWAYTLVPEDITAMGEGAERLVVTSSLGGTTAQATRTLYVDTLAPLTPLAPILAVASDTGVRDYRTRNTTPVMTGTNGTSGDTVTLVEGSTVLGSSTVTNDGSWSITSSALGDGPHFLSARYTDAAGNVSGSSDQQSLTIDTTAPTLAISDDQSGTASDADSSVVYTFEFSENVTGFGTDSVTVSGGSKGSFSAVNGNTYTLSVSANDNSSSNLAITASNTGVTDTAGNALTASGSDNSQSVDTVKPTLSASTAPSTATTGGGNSLGDTITLTLTFDGAVNGLTSGTDSGIITVADAGVAASWSGVDGSTTRTLSYTVQSGQNGQAAIDEAALKTALVADISDAAGNAFAYTGDIANIDSTALPVVDSTAPTVTNTSAGYTNSSNTLVITGTNYNTLLNAGETASTDIKARLNWSKLSWDIDGNSTTSDVSFSFSDIASAKVVDATHLSIVLTSGKGTALEATSGYGGTVLDKLDITAGFAKDAAGNAATSDALADGALTPSAFVAGDAVIDLGSYGKLIAPVRVEGNWYYHWDRSGDGTSAGVDYSTHDVLDGLFIQDVNGTTGGGGDTTDTYRYATLNGVRVALPTANGGLDFPQGIGTYQNGTSVSSGTDTNNTYSDLLAIWDANNGTGTGRYDDGTPGGWYPYYYWSATPSASGHVAIVLSGGIVDDGTDYVNGNYVALQVLVSTPSTTTPTLAITSNVSTLKAGDTATITFTFSEDPTGFAASDITTTNGTLINLAVSPSDAKVYTATFTPTASLASGNASITVAAGAYTDAASNNGGAGTTPSIGIDTLAPTLAITSNKTALKTGETASITFTFSEDPGDSFAWDGSAGDVAVSGGTLGAISGSGLTRNATLTPTAGLNSGIASITVAAGTYTDAATNNGGAGTTPSITIDTLAPAVPSLAEQTTTDLADNRMNAAESATTTFRVTLPTSGSMAVAGDRVELLLGGAAFGTAKTVTLSNADIGNRYVDFTVLVADLGADGAKSLSAQITDVAGNISSASAAVAFTLDTTAPLTPLAPILAEASDTGARDYRTRNTTPVMTGTNGTSGDTVTLVEGSTVLGSSTVTSDGSWSITCSALADGNHLLSARYTDAAGNVSGSSDQQSVTIDSQVPTLAISSNVSALKAGQTATITFTFSEDPGSSFAWDGSAGDVVVSGGTLGALSGNGLTRSATFTPTANLASGSASIWVAAGTYTDAAANSGSAGTTPSITIDTLEPAAPSLAELTTTDLADNRMNAAESATTTFRVALPTSGSTAVVGDRVELLLGGAAFGTAKTVTLSNADIGNRYVDFTVLVADLGADGAKSLSAQITDVAGNISSASAAVAFTLDTTAPLTPLAPILAEASDTGVRDYRTRDTTPDMTGTNGTSGDTVTLVEGSTVLGTTTVTSDGSWAITSSALTDGQHLLSARYTDAAGNVSGSSDQQSLTIDTTTPTLAVTSNKTALKTGETANITFTFSEAPTGFAASDITTTGGNLSNLTVSPSDAKVYTATFTPTVSLASGNASITVAAGTYTDAATNSGGAGTTPSIGIDTLAPTLAITSNVSALKAGQTATITFTFSEDPGDSFAWDGSAGDVAVSGGTLGAISGSGLTRSATFTPTASLASGNASITVAAGTYTDAATNGGGAGTTPSISIDTLAPTLAITSNVSALKAGQTATITFTFSEDPGSSFAWDGSAGDVVVSGGTLGALSGSGLTRSATFTPTASLASGNASITVAAGAYTDAATNSGGAGTTPSITIDTLAPTLAITSNVSAVKAGETATITFTFSEDPGSSFAWDGSAGDVVVSGGTLGALSGNGLTRSATFTPTANLASGSASIWVAAGTYTDAAANSGSAGTTPSITIDTLEPAAPSLAELTTTDLADNRMNAAESATTTFRVALPTSGSTAVVGDRVELLLGGAAFGTAKTVTLSNTHISNGHVDFTVLVADLGADGAKSLSAQITDVAGNTGSASTAVPFTLDTTAPTAGTLAFSNLTDTGSTDTIPGTTDGSFDLSLTGNSDANGTSVTYQQNLNGGGWTGLGSNTLSGLADGRYQFRAVVTDPAGNVSNSNNVSVVVDNTAPTVTNTSAAYTSSSNTLVITGTNYDTLLYELQSGGTDIKAQLDWSKLSWDINGDNASTANVSFSESDILEAVVVDATHLSIELKSAKGTALEATSGYGGTTLDTLDITAGFAKDAAGNAATGDALVNGTLTPSAFVAGDAVIDLGSYGKLIAPVQVEGNWYYYWDRNSDGTSTDSDWTTHDVLDGLFTQDINGATGGGGNTTDTYRYTSLNGVRVALPTANGGLAFPQGIDAIQTATAYSDAGATSNGTLSSFNDLLAIWDAYNGTGTDDMGADGTPGGWRSMNYWSATSSATGHVSVGVGTGFVSDDIESELRNVALQVL